jgi:hypothetical protein
MRQGILRGSSIALAACIAAIGYVAVTALGLPDVAGAGALDPGLTAAVGDPQPADLAILGIGLIGVSGLSRSRALLARAAGSALALRQGVAVRSAAVVDRRESHSIALAKAA